MDDETWWASPCSEYFIGQIENTSGHVVEVAARWHEDSQGRMSWEYAIVRWRHGRATLVGQLHDGRLLYPEDDI